MIRTSAEVQTKILFQPRDKPISRNGGTRLALQDIVNHVEYIIRAEYPKSQMQKRRRDIVSKAAL
jgi:hypothetical protein